MIDRTNFTKSSGYIDGETGKYFKNSIELTDHMVKKYYSKGERNMISEILKRLQDKVILSAILANIVLILNIVGVFKMIGIDQDTFTKVIELILAILVGIGIIKQPNSTKEQ